MTADRVEDALPARLRALPDRLPDASDAMVPVAMLREAADEIDRLRAEVARLSNDGCTCGFGGLHEPLNKRCALNGGAA